MTRSLDFTTIIDALENASAFELHRLRVAIDHALDDPARIVPVKTALHVGMQTSFFDHASNGEIPCTVIRVNRKTVTIQQHEDAQYYDVPYYMLNIEGADTTIRQHPSKGLSRQELSVGENVGFVDTRTGRQIIGKVERLNSKSVSIRTSDGRWRVAYSLLFPVIEGQLESGSGSRVIDALPEPQDKGSK